MNSTITSFVPNYRESETFKVFQGVQMNQTITEGFGVGQVAANMDIPSLNLESMKTTSQKKNSTIFTGNIIRAHLGFFIGVLQRH